MSSSLLLLDFVLWYYTIAFRDILVVWSNFMWFIVHFFSMPLLLRTLFAPWKRITDEYHITSIEDVLSTFVLNTMTRVFGGIVRLFILIAGLVFLVFGVLGLFISIALWICMPIGFVVTLFYGVMLITI